MHNESLAIAARLEEEVMRNNEKIALFTSASRSLNELRKAKMLSVAALRYLSEALDKLHAAYSAEICAGLKPEEDKHAAI